MTNPEGKQFADKKATAMSDYARRIEQDGRDAEAKRQKNANSSDKRPFVDVLRAAFTKLIRRS